LPVPIKQCGALRGLGNMGEGGVGASEATDLADRTPSRRTAVKQLQSCYMPLPLFLNIFYGNFIPK